MSLQEQAGTDKKSGPKRRNSSSKKKAAASPRTEDQESTQLMSDVNALVGDLDYANGENRLEATSLSRSHSRSPVSSYDRYDSYDSINSVSSSDGNSPVYQLNNAPTGLLASSEMDLLGGIGIGGFTCGINLLAQPQQPLLNFPFPLNNQQEVVDNGEQTGAGVNNGGVNQTTQESWAQNVFDDDLIMQVDHDTPKPFAFGNLRINNLNNERPARTGAALFRGPSGDAMSPSPLHLDHRGNFSDLSPSDIRISNPNSPIADRFSGFSPTSPEKKVNRNMFSNQRPPAHNPNPPMNQQ